MNTRPIEDDELRHLRYCVSVMDEALYRLRFQAAIAGEVEQVIWARNEIMKHVRAIETRPARRR